MVHASDRTLTSLTPVPHPHRGVGGRPKPVRIRHRIPPPWARRRVSTDFILGASAPSPAHHDILQGFSWSCLSIRAQVRELPFDWFLRSPSGGGAGAPSGSHRGSLRARPYAFTTDLGIGAMVGGSGTAGRDARGPVPLSNWLTEIGFQIQ